MTPYQRDHAGQQHARHFGPATLMCPGCLAGGKVIFNDRKGLIAANSPAERIFDLSPQEAMDTKW
jgi:hypothetical protein